MKKLDRFGSNVYNGLPTREPILNYGGYLNEFLNTLGKYTIIIFWVYYGGKFYGVF